MTWKEFKEEVDSQLEEQGISEETEFWYIDVSPCDIAVKLREGKLQIS